MALFPQEFAAFKRLTSSGSVSDAGHPILIMGYSVLSALSVAQPTFINGSDTSGNTVFKADPSRGAITKERLVGLAKAVIFPKGCYVNFDVGTSAVTVFYTLAA